jgi:hypothetical protein
VTTPAPSVVCLRNQKGTSERSFTAPRTSRWPLLAAWGKWRDLGKSTRTPAPSPAAPCTPYGTSRPLRLPKSRCSLARARNRSLAEAHLPQNRSPEGLSEARASRSLTAPPAPAAGDRSPSQQGGALACNGVRKDERTRSIWDQTPAAQRNGHPNTMRYAEPTQQRPVPLASLRSARVLGGFRPSF